MLATRVGVRDPSTAFALLRGRRCADLQGPGPRQLRLPIQGGRGDAGGGVSFADDTYLHQSSNVRRSLVKYTDLAGRLWPAPTRPIRRRVSSGASIFMSSGFSRGD